MVAVAAYDPTIDHRPPTLREVRAWIDETGRWTADDPTLGRPWGLEGLPTFTARHPGYTYARNILVLDMGQEVLFVDDDDENDFDPDQIVDGATLIGWASDDVALVAKGGTAIHSLIQVGHKAGF